MLTMKTETSYSLEFNEDDRINLIVMLQGFLINAKNIDMEELVEEYLSELTQGE